MPSEKMILPDTVGAWKVAGPPQKISTENIFDYMDGAGELYLAYHFADLLAYEYRDGGGNDILVELYRMKGSDDAFGLLSLDWGGEEVVLQPGLAEAPTSAVAPGARALYGKGLLRLWSGDLYARVMAVRETPAARETILKLGAAIAAGRMQPPPPDLLRFLPESLVPEWRLKKERTGFFRTHLVLNSLYYLSHENILDLGPDCEAVFAVYEGDAVTRAPKRVQLLVIQYPDQEGAVRGLAEFFENYIPERAKSEGGNAAPAMEFYRVEDGWLGCRRAGRRLALAFGCPQLKSAQEIMGQIHIEK